MDFLETYPDAYIRYHTSYIQPNVQTYTTYIVLLKARSRIAVYII